MTQENIGKKILVPRILEAANNKVMRAAILGAGFLALGGGMAAGSSYDTERVAQGPAMVLNVEANPLHMSAQDQSEVWAERERACGGALAAADCWSGSGINPSLWTVEQTRFNPVINVTGSETHGITADTFTTAPLEVAQPAPQAQ